MLKSSFECAQELVKMWIPTIYEVHWDSAAPPDKTMFLHLNCEADDGRKEVSRIKTICSSVVQTRNKLSFN